MVAKCLFVCVASALVLVASAAQAGAPLPSPPCNDGGFVPDNAARLMGEQRVAAALSTLARSTAKCIQKAVASDFRNDADTASDEASCHAKALATYTRAVSRLSSIPAFIPPCLGPQTQQDIAASIVADVEGVASTVFCEGPASASTGLNRPSSSSTLSGETKLWKAYVNALTQSRKCFDRTVKSLFEGDAVSDATDDHDECLLKAQLAYESKAGNLNAQGAIPPCFPPADVVQLGLTTVYLTAGSTTGETYCE